MGLDPFSVGMIGAAGLSGLSSFFGQERANAANVRSAREQMRFQERMIGRQESFQERMSNTAVQRQVADLKAAGLNPALAVMKGTPGASSPAGSSAVGSRAEARDAVGPAVDRAIQSVNTSLAAKRQKAEIELVKSQAMKVQQETLDLKGDEPHVLADGTRVNVGTGKLALLMLERMRAEIANLASSRRLTDVQRELGEMEKPGAANRARLETMIGREFGVGGQAAKGIVDVLIQMLKLGISARSGPVPLVRNVSPIGFGR